MKQSKSDRSWDYLRKLTSARIGLGRTGVSLPTKKYLDFQLAFAKARDAVYAQLDIESLQKQYQSSFEHMLVVQSEARDRFEFLNNPGAGRRLSAQSKEKIEMFCADHQTTEYDIVIVLSDGLSAQAVHENGSILIRALLSGLKNDGWKIAPLCIAEQARVALGDEIAHLLRADLVLMLIGERPGLTSPKSLGAYFTYKPQTGTTDEKRNCVSNIHNDGQKPEDAAKRLLFLLTEAQRRKLSGVSLKDTYTNALGVDSKESLTSENA